MIEKLCEIEPRPWSEYGKSGKAITQNQLARLLKPLGIAPVLMRIATEDGTEERAGLRAPPVRGGFRALFAVRGGFKP